MRTVLTIAIISLACWGCGNRNYEKQEPSSQIKTNINNLEILESPALPGSELPNLFTADDGSVYLSWVQKSESNAELLFSRWDGSSWSASRHISISGGTS